MDVHAYTSGYCDLVSLGQVCRRSGGQLSYVSAYQHAKHALKLQREVLRGVTRPAAQEAVLRVRCSTGLCVENYYGSFNKTLEGDIEMPSLDADKTLAVELRLEADIAAEKKEASVQCAVLYTAPDGSRRIRVHTLAVTVSNNISSIFRCSDLDSVVNFMAKRAVTEAPDKGLEAVRASLISTTVQILYVYRKFCATNPAPGQLILPESLKLLPLYTLGLLKNKALTTDVAIVRNDQRAYLTQRLLTLSAAETSTCAYPRLFALHSLSPSHGCTSSDGHLSLPPSLSLTAEKLDTNGAYLLDNGEALIFWLGTNLPKSFVQQVFNVGALGAGDAASLELHCYDNDVSRRICSIVEHIRASRPSYQVLCCVCCSVVHCVLQCELRCGLQRKMKGVLQHALQCLMRCPIPLLPGAAQCVAVCGAPCGVPCVAVCGLCCMY